MSIKYSPWHTENENQGHRLQGLYNHTVRRRTKHETDKRETGSSGETWLLREFFA